MIYSVIRCDWSSTVYQSAMCGLPNEMAVGLKYPLSAENIQLDYIPQYSTHAIAYLFARTYVYHT